MYIISIFSSYKCILISFGRVFKKKKKKKKKKKRPLKKQCPGGRAGGGASIQVNVLVNRFSKLHVKRRTSRYVIRKGDNYHFLPYELTSPDIRGLLFG